MAEYYLQQGDSTSTIYSLDIVGDLDIGLPSMDFKLVDVKGEGGQIEGVGVQKGRVIEFNYFFKSNFEYERDEFIDWLSKGSEITLYLYKKVVKRIRCALTNTSTAIEMVGNNSTSQLWQLSTGDVVSGVGITAGSVIENVNSTNIYIDNAATNTLNDTKIEAITYLGRARVYPQPKGGEPYKVNVISDSVNFSLIATNPFFTSTTLTTIELNSTAQTEKSTTVNISGYRTPATFEFTPNENFSVFQVLRSDGYGFRANRAFQSGEVISVNTGDSELTMTIDSNEITGIFSDESTPFMLEKSTNTINVVASNSTDGALKVKYYERRL